MPIDSLQIARFGGAPSVMHALADGEGAATHPHLARLARNDSPLRDLADAAHYLCLLHGRHPGVLDHALAHAQLPVERSWLEAAAEAFAAERAYIVRLVAAAGPMPSTPGQAESEAATAAQRHAIDMLAQSDRAGTPTGAAVALAADWIAIRQVLDAAANRLGMTPPRSALPPMEETATVVDTLVRESHVERAMLFGAQQILAQHRGLFDLLDARASARERH